MTFRVLAIAEGTQLRAVRKMAMDLISREYVLRTTQMIEDTQIRVSLVLRANVNSANCVRVTMGTVLELPALENEVLGLSQECSRDIHVFLF